MTGSAQMLTVRVPLAVRKRGGRKLVVTPGSTMNRGPSGGDSTLVKALARAFRWRRMMEAGRYGTINELATAEKINSSYVSRLLRLTLLAPDIVEAILDGRQPEGMTLPGLMEPLPVEWGQQIRTARCSERAEALGTQPRRVRPACPSSSLDGLAGRVSVSTQPRNAGRLPDATCQSFMTLDESVPSQLP